MQKLHTKKSYPISITYHLDILGVQLSITSGFITDEDIFDMRNIRIAPNPNSRYRITAGGALVVD